MPNGNKTMKLGGRVFPAALAVLLTILLTVVSLFSMGVIKPALATPDGAQSADDLDTTDDGIAKSSALRQFSPAKIMPFSVAETITGPMVGGLGGANYGPGFLWNYQIGQASSHWLGPMNVDGVIQWCRNFDSPAPVGPPVTERELTPRPLNSDPDLAALQVQSNEQMGYIIERVNRDWADDTMENQAVMNAVVSTIVHLSYEEGGGVAALEHFEDTLQSTENGQLIARWAKGLVDEAKENAGASDASGELVVAENRQDFIIKDLGVQQKPNNNWIGNVPVTVTITSGNGVFETSQANGTVSADGLTWTGVTVTSPLTLKGHSTANGDIKTVAQFEGVKVSSVIGFERENGTQDTVKFTESASDPKVDSPYEPIVRDFQPMLTSSTEGAGSKIVAPGTTVLKDELTVFADPDYEQGEWLGAMRTYPGTVGYKPLPVTFKGTAYDVGTSPIAESETVPADAKVVAETTFVAEGPGTYTVEVPFDGDPRFVTWVWEVDKDNQPEIAEDEIYMLAGNWSDAYGVEKEQTSVQWPGKIESNVKIHPTNDNTYLVDDVWLSEMPKDHPNFNGGFGFGADNGTITQSLYFWADKSMDEVTSLDDAELIGTVDLPAKNGFYPSVGDLDFKIKRDEAGNPTIGTYQFVHEFTGDDRVAPFTSPIPDANEMYEVTGEPQIGTTAMGEIEDLVGAFEDVTITDQVCYMGLKPGKEYVMEGTLMNQATGKELLGQDGKPITGSTTFTPESAEGCVDVEFKFNAVDLAGTTTVVFEDLFLDGIKVTSHADIEDEDQTVYIPDVKTTATTPEGGKEVERGPVTVVDKICYTNVSAGKEYKVEGVLVDKSTGKPLLENGKEITSSATFTADKSDGCVDVEFKFDASKLGGREIVVFEDMYREDVLIATHADLNDVGQTVKVKSGDLAKTGAIGIGAFALIGVLLLGGGLITARGVKRKDV